MSTEEDIYAIAASQTGKSTTTVSDADLLNAMGTDNAISRDKDHDPESENALRKNISKAKHTYGISKNDDEEIDSTIQQIQQIRRLSGLDENAVPFRVKVQIQGQITEAVIWADNRVNAALIASNRYGNESVISAPRRA